MEPEGTDSYFFGGGGDEAMEGKPHFRVTIEQELLGEKHIRWEETFKLVFFAQNIDTIIVRDITEAVDGLIVRQETNKDKGAIHVR